MVASLMLVTAVFAKPPMHEASMNFDLKNVEPFLKRLESKLHLGLPVYELVKFTSRTKLDQERALNLQVVFRGSKVPLDYQVFMDDVDSPDLYFFTLSQDLARAIDKELASFADEHGM